MAIWPMPIYLLYLLWLWCYDGYIYIWLSMVGWRLQTTVHSTHYTRHNMRIERTATHTHTHTHTAHSTQRIYHIYIYTATALLRLTTLV